MALIKLKVKFFYRASPLTFLIFFQNKIADYLESYFLKHQNREIYKNSHLFIAFIANFIIFLIFIWLSLTVYHPKYILLIIDFLKYSYS